MSNNLQFLIKQFLGILFILMLYSFKQQTETPPNIVIIFPDQFRQYSLGFWSEGNNADYLHGKPDPVSTPAIDKLAREGIVFNRAVSNFPLCSPYRGMLLSGMYPDKNGITANCHKNRPDKLRSDAECITDVLAKAGYETAYFGKCHWQKTEPLFDENGTYRGTTNEPGGKYINAYDTYVPPGKDRHGIKYFFQTLRDTHFDPLCYSNDSNAIEGLKDGELYQPRRFSSELETEAILNYLSNSHQQRDTKKPFCLIWSLNPPHNPWNEKSTDMRFYSQYTKNGKVEIDRLLLRENADTLAGNYAAYYFANVSAVDYYIGQVLEKLEELGMDDNTIIVFTSDHGEMLGSHGFQGKNIPEAEAYNIPFIINWGDKLKHRIEEALISVPDVMPTLLGLAGMKQQIPDEVQGTNYAGLIKNPDDKSTEKHKAVLYIGYQSRGIYNGDYTFVVNEENGKFQNAFCYNNIQDPYQLNKIEAEKLDKELLKYFKSELYALLKETEDDWYAKNVCSDFFN